VFQPHRYTRTLALGRDFPAAFAGVDELVLLPVYAASEKPLPGGSVWDLYRLFREQSRFAVSLASSLAHAWACFKRRLEPGDVFLVVGAGDVERIADWARAEIGAKGLEALSPVGDMRAAVARLSLVETALREMEPLAARTTLGVGGPADLWAEIGCESDLVRLLGWCRETGVPFHLVGAGSNLVVSDLGVAGVVGRLTGRVFHGVRREQTVLVAGGGVPLQRLLGYAEEQGLSGLEFLDGIPGTVGGAVRMNAGAWGEETGARVRRVRGVRPDGTEATLAAGELNFGYRSCRTLEGWIVLEVWLACGESTPGAVRERRAGFASRRAWMKGLRSAGSVFKNPLGQSAGQLLEAAGFKGYAVGGAMFSPLHANVITTRPGAQGSDVVALMQTARETVEARSGIRLEPEVVFLE
jgi:UDP-N-acetylenolpyruvoylglucosamine reductase